MLRQFLFEGDPSDDEVAAILQDAWAAMDRESYSVALESFETAVALAERTESEYLSVACYGLGAALSTLKQWRRAMPPLERARILFRANGHILGEAASLATLSLSYWSLWRRRAAIKKALEAYGLTSRFECEEALYNAHLLSGFLLTFCLWRHAETVSRRMAELSETLCKQDDAAIGWTRAASAALKRDRRASAERYLDNAERFVEEARPESQCDFYAVRARVLALTSRRDAIEYLNTRNVKDFSGILLNRLAIQKLRFARSQREFKRAIQDIRTAIDRVAEELP